LKGALKQNSLTLEQFQGELLRDRDLSDLAAQAEMTTRLQQRQGAKVTNPNAPLVGAALTLKEAQGHLTRPMGTKLPETGYFHSRVG